MYRSSTVFALLIRTGLPAFAHLGEHAALSGETIATHAANSPFHLALPLLAVAILGVALKRRGVNRALRDRITTRRS